MRGWFKEGGRGDDYVQDPQCLRQVRGVDEVESGVGVPVGWGLGGVGWGGVEWDELRRVQLDLAGLGWIGLGL